jgi:hypothetical protein
MRCECWWPNESAFICLLFVWISPRIGEIQSNRGGTRRAPLFGGENFW